MSLTEEIVSALQSDIETRLARVEPDVEVLLAEVVSGTTLRLFIDHPDGVTLGLCERVSGQLNDLRDRYSLEVSSPGADRPLTKPRHFRRFLGRKVRVRLREATRPHVAGGTATRRRSIAGELVGASDTEITIAAADGVITLPYEHVLRCNLVPGD
jgi:ribosome maturation factor RimP